MEEVLLARWQFGITTVYHWLFVPITLGITWMVAIMETAWVRTKKPEYLRMTKFWGKLMLINFAIGVVTGIVQEFQFGMNWSTYSRFVGDIFGAPLAIEALLAFFIESTFLGLKEMGLYEEALDILNKGEACDNERTDIYNLMGFCHFKLKQHEEAIEAFARALDLNPGSAIDYANIGSNYREMGEKDKAIYFYEIALSIDPSIDFARESLAKLEKQ